MPVSFETAFYELGLYLSVGLLVIVVGAIILGLMTLPGFYAVLFGVRLLIAAAQSTGIRLFNYLALIFRNMTRNLLRTSLTYVAIFVLVFVISGIWSMLNFIDSVTQEKENNLKAIITEKYKIPSQMPRSFEREVIDIAFNLPEPMRPKNGLDDIMTWSFVGGSTDPNNRSLKNIIFFFAMEPRKLLTMMDGLEEFFLESGGALLAASREVQERRHADDEQADEGGGQVPFERLAHKDERQHAHAHDDTKSAHGRHLADVLVLADLVAEVDGRVDLAEHWRREVRVDRSDPGGRLQCPADGGGHRGV